MKKEMSNRVAELGFLFWVIKIFSTTVGETAADFVSENLHLGLVNTAILMGALTILITLWNFKQKTYFPPSYWSLIVIMSIEGTLITDLLVDGLGVSLILLDMLFAVAMIGLFLIWYRKEQTLSIHSINNTVRERYYWIIVLTTFALGTGVGDTLSEHLEVGYLNSFILFGSIFMMAGVFYYLKLIKATPAFWIAFIVTRPIGASVGDLCIQEPAHGGLGWPVSTVNEVFFFIIISAVLYLTWVHKQKRTFELKSV
ncbi:MAG: hypothetical protein GC180_07310 [Bacteroidetes bacterium]|nr:hypothetical protein [Bacteroidota bacterium]